MNNVLRIILAVLTLLSALGMLGLSIFAITIPHIGLSLTCFVLAVGLSLFCYRDFQFFFGKKTTTPVDVNQK